MRSLKEAIQLFVETDEQLRDLERRARQDPALWPVVHRSRVRAGLRPHRLTHLGRIWTKAVQQSAGRANRARREFVSAAQKLYPHPHAENGRYYQLGNEERKASDVYFSILKHIKPHPNVSRASHLSAMAEYLRRYSNEDEDSDLGWHSNEGPRINRLVSNNERGRGAGPEPAKIAMRKAIEYHYPGVKTYFSSEPTDVKNPAGNEYHTLHVKFSKRHG